MRKLCPNAVKHVMAAALSLLMAIAAQGLEPAAAQSSPLELLMKERQQQKARQAAPKRAQGAPTQRAPRRVIRVRAEPAVSVDAIISETEPLRAMPPNLPPLGGLQPLSGVAALPISPAAPVAPGPEETSILVIGDSLGVQLGQGLRVVLSERPGIMIDSRARADTGLVNTRERNWPDVIRGLMASTEPKPDIAVVMIGANDNQRLPAGDGGQADQLSEPWRAEYSARIDAVLAPLRAARVPVIWVGLPVMKNARLSSAMLSINGIFQERVERAGQTYLDIWDQFSDDTGAYTPLGPDIAGDIQRMRAGDGVHFTKAGSQKLAFFVQQEISKALQPASEDVNLANLPADLNEQIREQNSQEQLAAPFGGAEAEMPPPFPVKPPAGPILTLTMQPAASALIAPGSRPKLDPATANVLIKGAAPYPKPGRADDFAWPR
jgi:uncharacterized protein